MSSVISICNLALSNIAKPNIQSIDGPEPEAQACKQFYGQTLAAMLQSYPWRFAGRTSALAELTNDKTLLWQYKYQRPTDCLKVMAVHDQSMAPYLPDDGSGVVRLGGYVYEIEGSAIYCDLSPAYLTYTKSLTDPTQFSPLFIEALSWALAVRLAYPLTRDPKVRADAYQLSQRTMGQAAAADANEVRETWVSPSQAIEARV